MTSPSSVHPRLPRSRTLVKAGFIFFAVSSIWMLAASWLVVSATRDRTYSDPAAIPARQVGLVLGCSRLLAHGRPNAFFDNRIRAASQLIRAAKVRYLVVSGDKHVGGYDEPRDMKDSLVRAGIPAERIFCDYAGFRTHDSVVRAREIFNQTAITIISQEFHNQRAIFIARHQGMDAIGFNAPEVESYGSFLTKCRELIARANMLLDLFVFRRAPRILGEKVTIPA